MANTVGVHELRRDLSEYLRRVERGQSFAATSRGRAVAVLGPTAEQRDPLGRLVVERHAIPARLDVLDVEPLKLPGGPPLSDLLDEVGADPLWWLACSTSMPRRSSSSSSRSARPRRCVKRFLTDLAASPAPSRL